MVSFVFTRVLVIQDEAVETYGTLKTIYMQFVLLFNGVAEECNKKKKFSLTLQSFFGHRLPFFSLRYAGSTGIKQLLNT